MLSPGWQSFCNVMLLMAATQISTAAQESALAGAFTSFTQAAASLEHSYSRLQGEVTRLRRELEEANHDLALSMEENRQLQEERERLRRRQALAEMSATLAHEIRNPLGSLELFTGLLAESGLEEQEREWVGHLQAGLRTMSATINNVLQFYSDPRAGFAPVDLSGVLRSTVRFIEPMAVRAKVNLHLSVADDLIIAGDRHRLEQMFLNLCLNSLQFIAADGSVTITAGPEGNKNWIEITDTGQGIPPGNLERIFEPGFSTRAGSPGLGLAVCKTIVEQHGGTIQAMSPPNCGATFRIEFPMRESE